MQRLRIEKPKYVYNYVGHQNHIFKCRREKDLETATQYANDIDALNKQILALHKQADKIWDDMLAAIQHNQALEAAFAKTFNDEKKRGQPSYGKLQQRMKRAHNAEEKRLQNFHLKLAWVNVDKICA